MQWQTDIVDLWTIHYTTMTGFVDDWFFQCFSDWTTFWFWFWRRTMHWFIDAFIHSFIQPRTEPDKFAVWLGLACALIWDRFCPRSVVENDTLTQNWCAAAMQHLQYLANIPAEVHFSQRVFAFFAWRICIFRCENVCFAEKKHFSEKNMSEMIIIIIWYNLI